MGDLTKNFDRSEFACKCGCGLDDINMDLVDRLQSIRDVLGVPLRVNSGCRCFAHNQAVGGVPDSAHLRCNAADLAANDSELRWRLVKAAYGFDFERIGVAQTFVHLDVDPFAPQPRLWRY